MAAPSGATVELRQGTEAALLPGEQFDGILTFFVLDCFTEDALPAALARLQAARRPKAPGWLLISRPPGAAGIIGLFKPCTGFSD
ncbi:hypothetical protein [Hymenobacter sp. BRD67]|uniref:hypothetical protein n=1 Tax=Hymenobacter sp. BRD67 TaxID=2675877 RepID=UPI001565A88F|nr:hypothetical protein [Hymenobacter sp. BRD67]QKG52868.1 hypothetical protein GKZ67_09950 [Hymenobacter sp. BRD67]